MLSQVIFHEFTHICSNIHKEMFLSNGLWEKIKNNVEVFTGDKKRDYIDESGRVIKSSDSNNPYNYIMFGALFMDEVIAENVATEMVKEKYHTPTRLIQRVFDCGDNNLIKYTSRFEYYGIGEKLLDKFAKTLFIQGNRNLNALSRESFRENFVYDLINQHSENSFTKKAFIDEIALMGVIAHTIEKQNGRYSNQERISGDMVYHSIFQLDAKLESGYENRNIMPSSIVFPTLY